MDLLVLDIDLFDNSGLDLIPMIKRVRPSPPLRVVSSDNSFEIGREIAKSGVWLFLIKSIEIDKFKSYLRFLFASNVQEFWERDGVQ